MQLLDRLGAPKKGPAMPFPLEVAPGVSYLATTLCYWCEAPSTGIRFFWPLRYWLGTCDRHMLEAPAGERRRLERPFDDCLCESHSVAESLHREWLDG